MAAAEPTCFKIHDQGVEQGARARSGAPAQLLLQASRNSSARLGWPCPSCGIGSRMKAKDRVMADQLLACYNPKGLAIERSHAAAPVEGGLGLCNNRLCHRQVAAALLLEVLYLSLQEARATGMWSVPYAILLARIVARTDKVKGQSIMPPLSLVGLGAGANPILPAMQQLPPHRHGWPPQPHPRRPSHGRC